MEYEPCHLQPPEIPMDIRGSDWRDLSLRHAQLRRDATLSQMSSF
jgi:hypothetical protein